jgi:hypothetical protein
MRVFTNRQGWPAFYSELLASIPSFSPHTVSLNAPFPQLSLKEIALAGAMAGAANAILASPGEYSLNPQMNRS